MPARHRPDLAAQECLWFLMVLRKWPDVQAALAKMICIVRRTDDGDLPAAQPMLSCAVEMIEVALLTVRDKTMGYRFEY